MRKKALDKKKAVCYNAAHKGASMGIPHVDYICIERHGTLQPHRTYMVRDKKTGAPKQIVSDRCDIFGCKIKDNEMVMRAYSKPWCCESRGKSDVESRIILAEVRMAGHPTEAATKAALVAMCQIVRPLTLEMLNKMKRPIEQGYDELEVQNALMPYINSHAARFVTNSFEYEDAKQQGFIGTRKAIETDRAIAWFGSHAFKHLKTNIRRPSAQSGVVRTGERDKNFTGNKGVLLAVEPLRDEHGNDVLGKDGKPLMVKIWSGMRSVDAPLSDDFRLADVIKDRSDVLAHPLQNIIDGEDAEIRHRKFVKIMREAKLTDQQMRVVVLQFGLADNVERTPTEVAKELGLTRQRINQQIKKVKQKIGSAAERLRIFTV